MITIDCTDSTGNKLIYGEFSETTDACQFIRLLWKYDHQLTFIVCHNGEEMNAWQFLKEADSREALGF